MISIFIKFIASIFLLIKIKNNVRIKIIVNSPLHKINKPETIEKKIIFFCVLFFISVKSNFKNVEVVYAGSKDDWNGTLILFAKKL